MPKHGEHDTPDRKYDAEFRPRVLRQTFGCSKQNYLIPQSEVWISWWRLTSRSGSGAAGWVKIPSWSSLIGWHWGPHVFLETLFEVRLLSHQFFAFVYLWYAVCY